MSFPKWRYLEKLRAKMLQTDRRAERKQRMSRPGLEQLESRILLTANNQLFVNTIYQDLFHRKAEPSGLAFWTGILASSAPRKEVALAMTFATDEYRTNVVQSLYSDLLKRPADTAGFNHFMTLLKSGGTDEQAKAEVIGSTEYFQTRAGQSNAGFVSAVYEDIFIRDPDSTGRASFSDQLSQGASRTQVDTQMLASGEYRQNVAEGYYEQYLFRTGETAGLQFWVSHLQQGDTDEQVLAGFPGEPEYSTQIEHRQPLSSGAPLAVPDSTNPIVATKFTLVGATADTPDELGLFKVDSQGRIGTLTPGSPGYAEAAISSSSSQIIFAQGQAPGSVQSVNLPAGSFVAFYLVQHKTTARLSLHNPTDQLGLMPTVYFSLPQANPDLFDHVHAQPNNQFAFEDLTGGGDRDFDDEVVQVDFAQGGSGDTTPPVIQAALTNDTGSNASDRVTFDPALAGTVTDESAIASFHAGFDNSVPGSYLDVSLDLQSGGQFSFARSRLDQINGVPLTDGIHTLHLQAQDAAGNASSVVDVAFTLDTQAPAIDVTSPAPDIVTDQNVTVTGKLSDARSGVDALQMQIDAGSFSSATVDANGNFSITTSLLLDGTADGQHTVHLRASDEAGNTSGLTDLSFTLRTDGPSHDFSDWTQLQVGGSPTDAGSVDIPVSGGATLHEGDSFNVTLRKTLTVPQQVSDLVFSFDAPAFDTTSQGTIKDAFEVAFVDANGNSLLQTIGAGQDAFFNVSEGQAAALAAGVTLQGNTVTVSLAGLLAGSTGTLVFRLVNNDKDTNTSVHVNSLQLQASSNTTPPFSSQVPQSRAIVAPIDFSSMSEVTSSLTANYGETDFR